MTDPKAERTTMTTRTITVVSAGLGQPSATRLLGDRLAEATVAALAARDIAAEVRPVELRDVAHDITNAMLTGFPAGGLREVLDTVAGADAVVLATPIFTTSYSGLFKSFLDVLDRDALAGRPVLVGATGGTARHSLAVDYAIRPVLAYLRADVVATGVFAATDDWAGQGDEAAALSQRIERAGDELAAKIAAREARSEPADELTVVPDFAQLLGR